MKNWVLLFVLLQCIASSASHATSSNSPRLSQKEKLALQTKMDRQHARRKAIRNALPVHFLDFLNDYDECINEAEKLKPGSELFKPTLESPVWHSRFQSELLSRLYPEDRSKEASVEDRHAMVRWGVIHGEVFSPSDLKTRFQTQSTKLLVFHGPSDEMQPLLAHAKMLLERSAHVH